jgi:hypothetical protein
METCWRNRLNLAEMAEQCECEHPIETYEARVGIRCRCCFGLVLIDGRGAIPNQCDGPLGHPGKHWSYMGACEPVADLVWEDPPAHNDGPEEVR